MSDFVSTITAELEALPVNTNSFYRRFKEERLTEDQLLRFAQQYFWFCKNFIPVLAGLIYNTPVDEAGVRLELVKTLYSELGYGKEKDVHLNLLRRFTTALGLSEEALTAIKPIPEVENYIRLLDEMFTRGDYRVGLGAEFGVEVTAGLEFSYLCPGVFQYSRFSKDQVYFFTFHLIEEQNHGDWLGQAVAKLAKTPEDEEKIRLGAFKAAALWDEFWKGMERYVFSA